MIRLTASEQLDEGGWGGLLRGLFALGDAAIAAWLWYALQSFTEHPVLPWARALVPVLAAAALSLAFATHRLGRPLALLLKALGIAAALAALGSIPAVGAWLHLSWRQALWFGVACASLIWLLRSVYFGTLDGHAGQPLEVLRWVLVGAAATLAMTPFYYNGGLGSGDAHWYTVMLGDFLTQLRAGVFPVWVGQSVYAFNGAVSPLRYAPGFQYVGGVLDLLTLRSLDVTALRNAELAIVAIIGAYSAYACIRPILRNAPWTACALAVLWITGPGILAPVMIGDQYMTFMTLPFVPLTLHGCWRLWAIGDRWSRIFIAAGLAGAWLCHSPIALWLTVIAACMYIPVFIRGLKDRRELRLAILTAAVFVILGAEPFVSVLTLDNQIKDHAVGAAAADVVRANFPGNFKPIDPSKPGLQEYQLGFSLLGALLLSVALMARLHPRGAWPFAAASVLIIPFTVPVPWLTHAIWTHLPGWFVTVQNIWPMQRLFLVWSSTIVFTAAIMLGPASLALGKGARAAIAGFLVCAIAWSAHEASRMEMGIYPLRATPEDTRLVEGPDNVQLSRYAYSSFAYSPSYFSHAYMDPWLENRLLDVHSMEPFVSNADVAGPDPSRAAAASSSAKLEQSGLWMGESITNSEYYRLAPQLSLEPGRHYALRLEFLEPGISGTLQLKSRTMFREYTLPDSGSGIAREGPSHAFGSEPGESHVLPIVVNDDAPALLTCFFVARHRTLQNLPFARFWMYSYDRERLPVFVQSWMPYKARVVAPKASYLETPRMWLKGWKANVNGNWTAALKSPENLVMIPVGVGTSHVTLEYFPPLELTLAFWVGALGWTALAVAAAYQLFLWSGGASMELAWVTTPGWLLLLLDALGYPFALAWRHKALSACAAGVAVAVGLVLQHEATEENSLRAVGPIRVEFARPNGFLGASQPILTTGRAGAATIVFVTYLDSSHARIGADVWGTLLQSQPVQMDYGKVQSIVVSDSALFPLKNPKVKALQPSEVNWLRSEISVELNGAPVIQAAAYAYETTAAQVLVGRAPFGSVADRKFTGEILSAQRLPIPRILALPAGRHAHMRVIFPEGRTGRREPILSVSSGSRTRVCYVSYLAYGKLKMTCWGPGGVPPKSAEIDYDPKTAHELDFIPGEAPLGSVSFDVVCEFDGTHLIGHNSIPAAEPPVIESGMNAFGAPNVDTRFTGPVMDVDVRSHVLKESDVAELTGPVHLVVEFPLHKPGRSEPLLSTGHTGAGDFIYVTYVDEKRVRFGFDHWGYGGDISAPVDVDYAAPHEIWISMGSLYPKFGDDKAWRGLDPGLRRRLRSRVEVVIDGRSVLSTEAATHPATPAEVTVARNAIGGSTSDPLFSGTVVFVERAGPVSAPAAK
jgi:hypothetical protein